MHEISAGVEHHTVCEPVPARFGQGADTCKVARLHRGLRLDFDPYDHAIVAFNHDIHPRASANHENETAWRDRQSAGKGNELASEALETATALVSDVRDVAKNRITEEIGNSLALLRRTTVPTGMTDRQRQNGMIAALASDAVVREHRSGKRVCAPSR